MHDVIGVADNITPKNMADLHNSCEGGCRELC